MTVAEVNGEESDRMGARCLYARAGAGAGASREEGFGEGMGERNVCILTGVPVDRVQTGCVSLLLGCCTVVRYQLSLPCNTCST